MLVKSIAAGTSEKFQLNYVPEKLILVSADNAGTLNNLVAVKVTPLGDGVICDLDAEGVSTMNGMLLVGGEVNAADVIQEVLLADGVVGNKVTDYEIVNSSAVEVEVYAPVTKKATTYIKSMQQTLLESSQVIFEKFSFLGFETADASQATVEFEDGASHTYSFRELSRNNSKRSRKLHPAIYNLNGRIKKVLAIPIVQQKAYLQRYAPLGNQ